MKWLLITTIGKNPGDEWIRIGIQRMIDEVDSDREYILLDKEAPSEYRTPIEFDKCIWCGMPVFWSLGKEQNCRIHWWNDLMLGWPSQTKSDFMLLGAGSFFPWGRELETIGDREGLIKSAEDVLNKSFYVTARDEIVSKATGKSIPHMICPAIFSIIGYKKSHDLKFANLMPQGGHYAVFGPQEAKIWDIKKYQISEILQNNDFIYVAHNKGEVIFARECGWKQIVFYSGDPYVLLEYYGRCGKYFGNRVHGAILSRGNNADVWSVGFDSRQEAVRLSGARVSRPSELDIDEIEDWASRDTKVEPFDLKSNFEKQRELVSRFKVAAAPCNVISAGLEELTERKEKDQHSDTILLASAQKEKIKQAEGKITQVLYIRPDSIGDNVLATSMLPYIRQKYANAKIAVVCQEHIAELYQSCPFVDDIIVFDRKRALKAQHYRDELVNCLRALKPDLSLNSVYSREPLTDALAIGCGARYRVAFEGDLSNISAELRDRHNKFYTTLLPGNQGCKSELARHRDFLHGLDIDAPSLKPMIWTTTEDQQFAENLFEEKGLVPSHTVALFPAAQYSYKVYQHYKEVLQNFKEFSFLILGGKDARSQASEICETLSANCYDLTGKTTIRQMASLMRRCRLYLGSDSAGAHIACAVGIPNVVVLGGGHFGRFFPYSSLTSVVCLPLECYRCNWKCRYHKTHCIKDIRPEVATEAIRQMLEKTSEKPRLFIQDSSLWNPSIGEPKWKAIEELPGISSVEVIPLGKRYPSIKKEQRGKIQLGEDKYLVTAIVSTYNSERFIRGCLEDLENQTIADRLEIIVVNSGSQQSEQAIVKEFQQKYDNIKYIRTDERETIYRAWNRAIKIASGKYITNANTDDRHRPDMFERLATELDRNENISVVYSQFYITTTENQTWQTNTSRKIATWVRPYSREQLLKGYCLGPQSMWRKSLHDEYGYFDETFKVCGDYEFFLRVSQNHDFLFIPEPLGLYLLSPNSLERVAGTKQQEDQRIWDLYLNNKDKIVRRPFTPATHVFEQLKAVNKLVNSSGPVVAVFAEANETKAELKREVQYYLSSVNEQEADRYQFTFVKCLKEYLDSGQRFNDIEQINEFAKNVKVSDGIPWFIGLLQSLWHLKNDSSQVQQIRKREQSVAILVSIYNETKFAELCFKSIRKLAGFPHYIVAVNNSIKDVESFKHAMLQEGLVDEWFDSGCTKHGDGLQKALPLMRRFRYIAMLDSDAVGLRENWLCDLVEQLNGNKAGLIGPQRVPASQSIIEYIVHPCCMIADQEAIGYKFQIDFRNQWPYWDVGGLLTWDCLLNGVPIVKVSHEYNGNSAVHSSLINNSIRHYWYTSRLSVHNDNAKLDGYIVGDIRQRLEREYRSAELEKIKEYHMPQQDVSIHSFRISSSPRLSVVLTTYNRPELLTKVLSGFAEQTVAKEDFEVVVVDDGSEPPVREVILKFCDRVNIAYLHQKNSGPGAARNNGVKVARGQIVLFSDDDDMPGPELIAEHLRSHQENPDERIAVLGHLDWHKDLHVTPLMYYVTHIGGEYFGFDNMQDGQIYSVWKFWSGLISAKLSLLKSIEGPFNSELHWGYEDTELACRLLPKGVKVLYNASAKSFILRAADFESFCQRRYKQGRALYYVASIHPEIIIPRYKLQHAANLYHSKYASFLDEWTSKVIRFEELANSESHLQRPDLHKYLKSLYTVYHECFVGYWLKGYVEVSRKAGSLKQMQTVQAGRRPCSVCGSPKRSLGMASGCCCRHPQSATGGLRLPPAVNKQPVEAQSDTGLDCNQLTEPGVTEPLRITFISTNTPGFDIGSSNLRIYHILKILVNKGHKIDYLYFHLYGHDSRYKAAFDGAVNFIKVQPTVNNFSDYLHLAKVGKLDYVWITNLWSVDYLGLAVQLTQWFKLHHPQTKVIIDTMDFHYKKFIRKFNVSQDNQDLLKAEQFLEVEKELYPLADRVVTVTEVEKRDILESIGSDCEVSVIPNIHRILGQTPGLERRKHICFIGGFHVSHNVDAVKWFVEEVFPLIAQKAPAVEFHILGFDNEKFKNELEVSTNIKVIGYVEDAESAVANYRLFVCPMTYGAGMKGKLGTAAASGTPIVTTTVGAEGFDFVDGQSCFIADEAGDFAQKCLRLLCEDSLWNQFSITAKNMVAAKFSIRAVSQKIDALLQPVTAAKSESETPADSVEVVLRSDYAGPEQAEAKPKVSIITSCYNSERFLPECLDSIRNQTMLQWELFLLDDGSTDGTRRIIEQYCRMDERIRPYYFQDNEGPYVRRNFAIERANSDFIVIQDADDIMSPAKLEVLYNEITKDQKLAVAGSFFQTCLEEFKGPEYTDSIELPTIHDKIMEQYFSTLYVCWHGSAIIRKSLFETIGLYDENPFGSDTFWLAKAAEYARYSNEIRFKNIPGYLTIKREHTSSQQGMLPIVYPGNRRARFTIFWLYKLLKIREKAQKNPAVNIKIELRNCKCNDFMERYSSFFKQWETDPLGDNVIGQLVNTAVVFFNNRRYVSSITTLNGIEVSLTDIAKRFRNYDLLRAMAFFAIDMKEQSLMYLNKEIQNHNNPAAKQFISDYFDPRPLQRSGVEGPNPEKRLKNDVQKWCAENSDLYDLQMIDTKTVPQTI